MCEEIWTKFEMSLLSFEHSMLILLIEYTDIAGQVCARVSFRSMLAVDSELLAFSNEY